MNRTKMQDCLKLQNQTCQERSQFQGIEHYKFENCSSCKKIVQTAKIAQTAKLEPNKTAKPLKTAKSNLLGQISVTRD